jgi:plasmid rolling circle replication initiator protein Rep
MTYRRRWKRAVLHWFRALQVTPGRTRTYHPHFHVLLIVPAKYFELGSPSYIGQAEWRVMWEQRLRVDHPQVINKSAFLVA